MRLEVSRVDIPFRVPFRIAYRVRTHAEVVRVRLEVEGVCGRGEALGVSYLGETADGLCDQIEALRPAIEQGLSRPALGALLPPGGARNALDCALWDLEAKRTGRRIWTLADLPAPRPLHTSITIGLDTPAAMARIAAALPYPILKLKLDGGDDLERVRAVRAVRPDARIAVDANQGWNMRQLDRVLPELDALGVFLVEQPLARGADDDLAGYESPIPLCADESCQTTESLPALQGKYRVINIKLDKTGGLSEALRLAHAGAEMGFGLMVGCMGGSSLSMAPAFIVGQLCSFVDLDGPLLARTDIDPPIRYDGDCLSAPEPGLWG